MVILLAMTSIYVVDFISQGNNFVSNQLIASISAIFNTSLILSSFRFFASFFVFRDLRDWIFKVRFLGFEVWILEFVLVKNVFPFVWWYCWKAVGWTIYVPSIAYGSAIFSWWNIRGTKIYCELSFGALSDSVSFGRFIC